MERRMAMPNLVMVRDLVQQSRMEIGPRYGP